MPARISHSKATISVVTMETPAACSRSSPSRWLSARREDAAGTRVVVETDDWVGFVPYASGWPYGLLLAPRAHIDGLPGLGAGRRAGLAAVLVDALGRYDRLFGQPFPYMLWVHQQPGYPLAHLHVHLAPPRRAADALRHLAAGELGSGTLFNPVRPEAAAEALRLAGRR